jgi:N-acetylmuramic acid 6-phosphate etherase
MLKTETPNPAYEDLDQYAPLDLVNAFVDDQQNAVRAVRAATKELAAAVEAAVPRIESGGRLIYVGAGTSGRLGLLDSVELYPTFTWPKGRAIALLAGGPSALHEAVEGAEDDREQGARDIAGGVVKVGASDVVILLAASGGTPYVLGALEGARRAGALTIGIANNPDAPVTREAEIGITLDTGPEVISGSTRLKAGTAQKVTLNTLSSAIMVRLNKVYKNLMVDVKPTNAKLIRRTVALTVRATGTDEATARQMLEACQFQVKVAIVAIARGIDVAAAEQRLAAVNGSVRVALAN